MNFKEIDMQKYIKKYGTANKKYEETSGKRHKMKINIKTIYKSQVPKIRKLIFV
jgi:hypothetical protein